MNTTYDILNIYLRGTNLKFYNLVRDENNCPIIKLITQVTWKRKIIMYRTKDNIIQIGIALL